MNGLAWFFKGSGNMSSLGGLVWDHLITDHGSLHSSCRLVDGETHWADASQPERQALANEQGHSNCLGPSDFTKHRKSMSDASMVNRLISSGA